MNKIPDYLFKGNDFYSLQIQIHFHVLASMILAFQTMIINITKSFNVEWCYNGKRKKMTPPLMRSLWVQQRAAE